MRKFERNESYSVGIKSLDIQHQDIVSHLNTMFAFFEDQTQRGQLGELCTKLEQYAKVHFVDEEKLFEKYKFPETAEHKKEHRLFEQKVKEFHDRLNSSDEHVTVDILEFLADWWMGHIQGCDKEYTRFLNNCGVF